MSFRTIFAAGLLLMGSAASVLASDNSMRVPAFGVEVTGDNFIPVPQADVKNRQPVLLAQAGSTQQLEEQIRLLNGKVEEMNFLVLQLQEQMRKMQEDNEFRFQELEKSKEGRAAPSESGTDIVATPAEPAQTDVASGDTNVGAPEKPLGSIKFDENGNPIGGSIEDIITEETNTAALPASGDPAELYRVAYDHVLAGEYDAAEQGFRDHISQFPKDVQTADARYWLGESLAAQDKHREAAEILLDAQRDFPKSKKAPDMLLKLGVSLAALDNKDVACATFAQVTKKYPKAGPALLERVTEEQAKAGC